MVSRTGGPYAHLLVTESSRNTTLSHSLSPQLRGA